ncbi:FliH/SctL family protein [Actinotalea sp. K2]|uniref:FliH/SctL family protein n=1 Tax=Actinotalea sp. K2 TaxID=2939438 RepID=UPI0020172386|nr:FliH/SctL family protein [Actinotalea sp. K2]MCL3860858.1 flagellar assembly protein FliH [Actinotalea sp. K2]
MSPEQAVTAFRPSALAGSGQRPAGVDERARAAGYAAGWAAGTRAAADAAVAHQQRLADDHLRREAVRDAAIDDALAVLGRAAQAVAAREAPVVTDARATLHAAALDLAAAVLQHELTPGPASAVSILDRALALPAELGVHTVRVSPADLAHVRTLLEATSRRLPAGLQVVADQGLRPGDVVSEHATGQLDGQIASALDRARRALLEDDA